MTFRQGPLWLALLCSAGCADYPADTPPAAGGDNPSQGGSPPAMSGGAATTSAGTSSAAGTAPATGGMPAVAGSGGQAGGGSASLGGSFGGGPPSGAESPAGFLDLTNWKLTLPVGDPGDPDEVRQPELDSFSLPPYFHLNQTTNGVIFRAHAGGVTTSGSSYPRSELREMVNGGEDEANWRTAVGTHSMTLVAAVTHLPEDKDQVVVGQIHDASSDLLMVRLTGKSLYVEGDGQNFDTLDDDYALGTPFKVKIVASGGRLRVYYNDKASPDVDVERNVEGCYFKAGIYTQANTETDAADSYGESIIYELSVTHE